MTTFIAEYQSGWRLIVSDGYKNLDLGVYPDPLNARQYAEALGVSIVSLEQEPFP